MVGSGIPTWEPFLSPSSLQHDLSATHPPPPGNHFQAVPIPNLPPIEDLLPGSNNSTKQPILTQKLLPQPHGREPIHPLPGNHSQAVAIPPRFTKSEPFSRSSISTWEPYLGPELLPRAYGQ
jgi:hypothetical protein